jgi:hypothetical protein
MQGLGLVSHGENFGFYFECLGKPFQNFKQKNYMIRLCLANKHRNVYLVTERLMREPLQLSRGKTVKCYLGKIGKDS